MTKAPGRPGRAAATSLGRALLRPVDRINLPERSADEVGMRGRQRAAVAAAMGLWVVVALPGPAHAAAAARPAPGDTGAGASEMIDDAVSAADQRVLARLADALAGEAGGARR